MSVDQPQQIEDQEDARPPTVTEYDWLVGKVMEMSKMDMEQCLDKMAAIFAKP